MHLQPELRPLGFERLVSGQRYTVMSLDPVWAWAVLHAGRNIESRPWSLKHRGLILLHASGRQHALRTLQNRRTELSFLSGLALGDIPTVFPRDAIVGSVEIVGSAFDDPSKWAVAGLHHWILRLPKPLEEPLHGVTQRSERLWHYTHDEGGPKRRASGVYPASG